MLQLVSLGRQLEMFARDAFAIWLIDRSVDFSSPTSFVRTVKLADLSDFLRCF